MELYTLKVVNFVVLLVLINVHGGEIIVLVIHLLPMHKI